MGSGIESGTITDNRSEGANIPAVGDGVIRESDPGEVGQLSAYDPQQLRTSEQQLMDRSIISPYMQLGDGSYDFLPWQPGGQSSGDANSMLLAHGLDGQEALRDLFVKRAEKPHTLQPFVDTGRNIEAGKPESWTLPTRENYAGWTPGDIPDGLNWGKQADEYVKALMQQNFSIDSDGVRKPINDFLDKKLTDNFRNLSRHAVGIGDLVFDFGRTPQEAQSLMMAHELSSPFTGLKQAIQERSWDGYNREMQDSVIDQQNNSYAAARSREFHDFGNFFKNMLNESWISATNESPLIGKPSESK